MTLDVCLRATQRTLDASSWPSGGRPLRLGLPIHRDSVTVGRHAVDRWLVANGVPADIAFDFGVAVSEACANAIEHALRPYPEAIRVEADRRDGEVTLSVRDFGTWDESPSTAERGYGLQLMRALMGQVQIVCTPRGTNVVLHRDLPAE